MSSSCFSSKVSHWVFSWVTCWFNFLTISPPQITPPCILPLHLACPRVHEEYQCPPAADWHSRVGWTMNEKADAAALQCIHKWWSHISWICRGKYFTWSLQWSTLQSNQNKYNFEHFKLIFNLPSHPWPPDPPECWMSRFDLWQISWNLSSPDVTKLGVIVII